MNVKAQPILLIVEDDEGLQQQLKWAYEDFEVVIASTRAQALELLLMHNPAVVTLDLGLPPDPDGTSEGMATLAEILRLRPQTKVIVASGHSARAKALEAVALGAYEFYAKPIDIDALGLIVARAFHVSDLEAENRQLQDRLRAQSVHEGLITAAPEMLAICQMIDKVAVTDASVMLLGASGTGKELLARALHQRSPRAAGPFVAINCAAIPDTLLESELFGYEKGAFTGAMRTTLGKIESAQNGTIFLDEVGDIPLNLQVKLLRFLQERVIERLGGRKSIDVDVRIICATHRDLDTMIAQGQFREDLWYRVAEVVVRIPSLAERSGDALLLARHFVDQYAKKLQKPVRGLSADACAAIGQWHWPGNVRELENRIKRAVIMAEHSHVRATDLDLGHVQDMRALNLRNAREIADRKAISQALGQAEGNISAAARLLGISRPTFYDLLRQYRMDA